MPEARVRRCSTRCSTSPLVPQVARGDRAAARPQARAAGPLVQRLRPRGDDPRGRARRDDRASATRPREAFAKDMPRILQRPRLHRRAREVPRRAHRGRSLARRRPRDAGARGAATSRTCAPASRRTGMNYKGYNIAVHELGHNVEQVFSLYDVDHTLLRGRAQHRLHRGAGVRVPGAGPRAARAWPSRTPRAERLRVLNDFWQTWEIAGVGAGGHRRVALDVRAPGRHRRASCARPRCAIAREVWNQLLRAGAGREGHAAARHLLAHDRLPALPVRLPARPPDRVPDRGAHRRQGQGDARRRSSSGWRGSARSRPTCGWRTPPARPSARSRSCAPPRAPSARRSPGPRGGRRAPRDSGSQPASIAERMAGARARTKRASEGVSPSFTLRVKSRTSSRVRPGCSDTETETALMPLPQTTQPCR